MFDKLLERLLNSYLDPYVNGIKKDGLSVLRGDLVFENLTLKTEAFAFFKDSRLSLRAGRIGRLRLQIPWRKLSSGKISLEVDTLALDVARVDGDIPDEKRILEEAREAKQARIEEQLKALQQFAEQASMDQDKSMTGRWMHRLVQNTSVKVTDMTIRTWDSNRYFSAGVLLRGFVLRSLMPAANQQTSSRICQLENLAAYVTVEGARPMYMLRPTNVQLDIQTDGSSVALRVDLCGESGGGSDDSVEFVASRVHLAHVLAYIRDLRAWSEHVQATIARYCRDICTNEDSLREEYMRLRKTSDISFAESCMLERIEMAVSSRVVARWRMEAGYATTMSESPRFGWWRGWRHDASMAVQGEDERRGIQRQEQADQAHLEDVAPAAELPALEVTLGIARVRVRIYDDGTRFTQTNADPWRQWSAVFASSSEDIRQALRYADTITNFHLLHELSLQGDRLSGCAKLVPRVITNTERYQWSFNARMEELTLSCDGNNVLSYSSNEPGYLISLQHVIRADMADRITVAAHMPAPKLRLSPTIVSVAVALVSLELPEPPTFEFYECIPAEDDCDELYYDEQYAAANASTAHSDVQADCVRQQGLVLDIDITISAPQLTVLANENWHLQFRMRRISIHAPDFLSLQSCGVTLEVDETHVHCYTFGREDGELDPISILTSLHGQDPGERSVPASTASTASTAAGPLAVVDQSSTPAAPPAREPLKAVRHKSTIIGAATGAALVGVAGGATGGAAGCLAGAAAGVPLALVTFGLSIPLTALVGGSAGICIGTFAGGAVGTIAGGAAGYGYQLRKKQ